MGESSHKERSEADLIGRTLNNRYRVLHRLGQGGMGTVYRGEHIFMERPVAIKVLHPHLITNNDFFNRFLHEARINSKLSHRNAVILYDFGVEGQLPYLVFEFVEGLTLRDVLLRDGYLTPDRFLNILAQVGSALAHAHELGIVHRDLKPENIIIGHRNGAQEHACVLDFGIAKVLHNSGNERTVVTQMGMVMGTPQYLSPEQALEKELDARSDIYSLGVIMYEMLTGEVPFRTSSPLEILVQHLNVKPKRIEEFKPDLDIPRPIADAVMQCLEKQKEDRFQSMAELLARLESARGSLWFPRQTVAPQSEPVVDAAPGRHGKIPAHSAEKPARQGGASAKRWAVLGAGALSAVALFAVFFLHNGAGTETTVTHLKQPNERQSGVDISARLAQSDLSGESALNEPKEELPAETASGQETATTVASLESQSQTLRTLNEIAPGEPSTAVNRTTAENAGEVALSKDSVSTVFGVESALESVSQEFANLPIEPAAETLVATEDQTATEIAAKSPDAAGAEILPAITDPDILQLTGEDIPLASSASGLTGAQFDNKSAAAKKILQRKEYLSAARAYLELARVRGRDLSTRLGLGTCFLKLQAHAAARRELNYALAVEPEYAPAHYLLAASYAATGRIDEALASLEHALHLFPGARKWIGEDEEFRALESSDRFQKLLHEVPAGR